MSAFTIILLTKHRLMRADFRGRGRPRLVGLWEQPRPAADDAGTLVDAALRLHSKRARRVWVLSSELGTNVLAIPAEVLRGVVAADMEQVLGFEAETLTGVSPMETSLAHVSLVASGSDRRYWTTQVANVVRQGTEQSVRTLGGKLLGMAHPGGVPWPLDTDRPTGPWERIEFWDDVVICLRAPAQAASGTRTPADTCPLEVAALPRSMPAARLTERIAAFRRESPAETHREVWDGTDGGAARLLPGEAARGFSDSQQRHLWLEAWAAQLSARRVPLPLLQPVRQPMSSAARTAIAVGLAASVLLGCVAHHQWQQRRLASLVAELQRIQSPQQRLDALGREFAPLDKRKKELETEVAKSQADVSQVSSQLESCRQRMPRLLESLSVHRHDDLVVQKIATAGGDLQICGVCLHVACVHELAGHLERELTSCGWRVQPPTLTDEPMRNPAGPWKFTIGLSDPSKAAAPASSTVSGYQSRARRNRERQAQSPATTDPTSRRAASRRGP